MRKRDAFDYVHQLMRERKWSKALSELYDVNSGRIRKKYADDYNHAWYLIGDIYYKTRHFAQAAKAFRIAIKRWPDDFQAMMAIANCYSEMRAPRWSAYYLKKAIHIQPHNAKLLYNLGNAYFDLGKYDAAIKVYNVACRYGDDAVLAKCRTNIDLAESNRIGRRMDPGRRKMVQEKPGSENN